MKAFHLIVAVLVSLWVVVLPASADSPATRKLTFGIAPQQAATELARLWTPMLARLSSKTGYVFEFKTAQDIVTFEQRIKAGEYDFAYYNPVVYAMYRENGYQAVARERDTQLVGIIVVPKDSRYKNLKDLEGATMAFPSPGAFAASVLPQMSLKQSRVSVVPMYVSTHESVYLTVARGLYPAGGGIIKTFNQADPAVRDQLRILWKSDPYTPHPIAVHPRVPKEVTQRVLAALLSMTDDPEGAALLKNAGFKGFMAAKDSDYEDIRHLYGKIRKFAEITKTK